MQPSELFPVGEHRNVDLAPPRLTLPFEAALFLLPFGLPRGLLGTGASLGSCYKESTPQSEIEE